MQSLLCKRFRKINMSIPSKSLPTHTMFNLNKVNAFNAVLVLCYLIKNAIGEMIGPADLLIKSIDLCPEPEQYKYSINVQRHKVNRTHEAFDGESNLGIPLDDDTSIYVNVATKANDGYKPNAYEFREDNACAFFLKWVGKSFFDLMEKIGQPKQCPLIAGNYKAKDFLIDYRQLPQTLPYGDFRADLFFIRDEEKVVCMRVFLTTKPKSII